MIKGYNFTKCDFIFVIFICLTVLKYLYKVQILNFHNFFFITSRLTSFQYWIAILVQTDDIIFALNVIFIAELKLPRLFLILL